MDELARQLKQISRNEAKMGGGARLAYSAGLGSIMTACGTPLYDGLERKIDDEPKDSNDQNIRARIVRTLGPIVKGRVGMVMDDMENELWHLNPELGLAQTWRNSNGGRSTHYPVDCYILKDHYKSGHVVGLWSVHTTNDANGDYNIAFEGTHAPTQNEDGTTVVNGDYTQVIVLGADGERKVMTGKSRITIAPGGMISIVIHAGGEDPSAQT
jgi:hypothetical protein